MVSARKSRVAAKIFSPFAYAAALVPVAFVVFWLGGSISFVVGARFVPPVVYLVLAYLVVGGVIYGSLGWWLLLLEQLLRPTLGDHFRRCALLYLFVALLGPLLVIFVDIGDPGAGGSVAIIVLMAAGYAVLMDALVLLMTRLRYSRVSQGGTA